MIKISLELRMDPDYVMFYLLRLLPISDEQRGVKRKLEDGETEGDGGKDGAE